jgi:hypothetical protein
MADDTVLQNAIEFYQKIKSEDEVTIKFRKLDGTERIMRCTLDINQIPEGKRPKDVNMAKIFSLVQKYGMIHVFDLDKKDWRTVPFERSEWLDTPNQVRFRMKK